MTHIALRKGRALLCAIVLTACGDAAESPIVASPANGDDTPPATSPDALACPIAMPGDGAACPCAAACEYGTDPELRCNTLMTGSHGQWSVSQWPAATGCDPHRVIALAQPALGCPVVRPHIGTACTTPNESCDYGACAGNVNLECMASAWQDVPVECATPATP